MIRTVTSGTGKARFICPACSLSHDTEIAAKSCCGWKGGRPDAAKPAGRMTETDPNGTNPHSPGAKLDAGKAALLRGVIAYFPQALEAVAQVSAFGAAKYTWNGWRSVPEGVDRYGDALVRHLTKEAVEGPNDGDSGLAHAAHAAWNALARLELMIAGGEVLGE